MKKLRFVIAPYDFWVGFFWNRKKRWLYILPIPMVGVCIEFGESAEDDLRQSHVL